MLVDLTITRARVRKFIRVRELAATHMLETMRRMRMLETQAAWKREGGSDKIKARADMHEDTLRRMRVSIRIIFILNYTNLDGRLPPENLPWMLKSR